MKNPILRGDPAPTGFAASVSGWLNIYLFQARSTTARGSISLSVRERLDRIDACSSLPVGVGDNDPRIRSLARATAGNKWTPGREQKAVVDGAGHNVPGETVRLDPEAFLNALAHAALLDLAAEQRTEVERIRKGTEAAPTQESMITAERERADNAESRVRKLEGQNEQIRADYTRERDKRRELQQILGSGEPVVITLPADHEPQLPKNVRPKGSGFQGYLKVDGKTISKTFATPEEAAGWVREQMNQRAVQRAAHDANGPGPHYEPDLSPEDRAAMEERAAA